MTARDRLVAMIVVTLVATVAAWILVISPKRDQANKLGSQVTAAQKQLDAARTQIATAELDRSSYARNYQAVAELGKAVPPDAQTPSLIFQLQNAASGARVDFRSVVLNQGATSAPAPTPATTAAAAATSSTQPITISFQGNFFHLANFLGRIERFVVATNKKVSVSGRLMTLNGISFAAASSGFPQITATITATTYLLPASEGLTTGAPSTGSAASATAKGASGTTTPTPAAAITP
ncbi:MAG TPA: type 4a pilus biogenesis protein PilO [Solirubrobacteraceae bacterium]|nr:type 4a pilus biogenesis protein PilO [Solirubrobacteraceae bacterium]